MIKVGSDFSGVGAFNQALIRLQIPYKEVFACDMDKYARQTFIHNYGEPEYYPENVYDREIPTESLDIYMTSPPCQAFSLAGKRLGKDDARGILFFNSYEFIQKNKPRYFIFENVKGLLSDDNGRTFQEWINYLGGKSVNGVPVIFPTDESVPYHIYWKVINAKQHGIPQNRERVFIVGIRDDSDNVFSWPKEEHLNNRLKDILEIDVDQKYYLSEKMVNYLVNRSGNFNNGKINLKQDNDVASCLTKSSFSIDISDNIIIVGNTNPSSNGMNGNVFDANGISPTLSTNKGEGIKIISATKKGYELCKEGDSINYEQPNSKTRKGRVGKGVAQTINTACMQGVLIADFRSDEGLRIRQDGNARCITSSIRHTDEFKPKAGTRNPPLVIMEKCIPVLTPDRPEKRQNGRRFKEDGDEMFTITTQDRHGIFDGYKIRRLTPRESFRLMDFPDSFTWPVSDSQAYKQAGNSIVVKMLELIISKLNQ